MRRLNDPNPVIAAMMKQLMADEDKTMREKGPDGYFEHKITEKIEWMVEDKHLTPPDVLRKAIEAKEKGDAFFRKGDLERAGICYIVSKYLDRKNAAAPNNAAEVMLRLHKYSFAELQASDALKLELTNKKALLRRAKARKSLGKFADAKSDLEAIGTDSTVDTAVERERAEIKRLVSMSPSEKKAWMARVPAELNFPGENEVDTFHDLGLMAHGDYYADGER